MIEDRVTHRFKGIAYVEFEDMETAMRVCCLCLCARPSLTRFQAYSMKGQSMNGQAVAIMPTMAEKNRSPPLDPSVSITNILQSVFGCAEGRKAVGYDAHAPEPLQRVSSHQPRDDPGSLQAPWQGLLSCLLEYPDVVLMLF
jgi:hypothetical protein